MRERLVRHGLEESNLCSFRVGYAPDSTELLREHLHMLFHARVMFPFRDPDGRALGFAGLATHLGPSWPLWLTSPDCDQFRTSAAIFAIGEAAPAIAPAP